MHKSVNSELRLQYLKLIGSCYATGNFEPLFPYLSNDCVWESQWRLTPENGKYAVEKYFREKGSVLQSSGRFPKWMVVELVDNMNLMRTENAKVGKEWKENISIGLLYKPGTLALFMSQKLDDYSNAIILTIEIDDSDCIKRIDLCMPELFKFVKYEKN